MGREFNNNLTARQRDAVRLWAAFWFDEHCSAFTCRTCEGDADGKCICGAYARHVTINFEAKRVRENLTEAAQAAIDQVYTDTWEALPPLARVEAIGIAIASVRELSRDEIAESRAAQAAAAEQAPCAK